MSVFSLCEFGTLKNRRILYTSLSNNGADFRRFFAKTPLNLAGRDVATFTLD